MLIDWHTHIWLPEHLGNEFGPGLDARYLARHGRRLSTAAAPEEHDRRMRESGIEHSIVIALTSRHLGMEIPNDFVAEYVSDDPSRRTGFASVDPNNPGAVAELRRAAAVGLRGLKLAPPYQNFHPHSEEAWEVYRAADELGLVVMFHQGAVFSPRGVLEVAQGVLLDKVAREFPDLRIIVAHFGQPWSDDVVALMYKHANVYADISARLHRPWQLHNILLSAVDYGVQGKVLFGSDFPALDPAFCLSALRGLNSETASALPSIDEAIIEGIVYERPLGLLGL
ncbi:MAG: amidohydrolase family protein [Actinobacteria bacterium]|nr:amidohydrolase family protein [Actinomycetota bacterium]